MDITFDAVNTARELVTASCRAMDVEDFEAYLGLCAEFFNYKITAHSREIRRDMVWLDKDKHHMKELLATIPKQNRDRTPLMRHATISSISSVEGTLIVDVRSNLAIYRTELDGGITNIFAVGVYIDSIDMSGAEAKLLTRTVHLETRMLGLGNHVPL